MIVQYLFKRWLYYLRTGATLISFPLTLGTFVKVVYPDFDLVMVVLLIGIVTLATAMGYFWLKKSGFYQAEIDVCVEANQYQSKRLVPTTIPMYEAFVEFLEKQGVDCSMIKLLLKNSKGSKYYEAN